MTHAPESQTSTPVGPGSPAAAGIGSNDFFGTIRAAGIVRGSDRALAGGIIWFVVLLARRSTVPAGAPPLIAAVLSGRATIDRTALDAARGRGGREARRRGRRAPARAAG